MQHSPKWWELCVATWEYLDEQMMIGVYRGPFRVILENGSPPNLTATIRRVTVKRAQDPAETVIELECNPEEGDLKQKKLLDDRNVFTITSVRPYKIRDGADMGGDPHPKRLILTRLD